MNSLSSHTSDLFRQDIFSQALGDAVVRLWSRLPQPVQHQLFEEALAAEWQGMRTHLATFLHQKHVRTASSVAARAMIEPDSLGG